MISIIFQCDDCKNVIEVTGTEDELNKIASETFFVCPWCGSGISKSPILCGSDISKSPILSIESPRVLTSNEFWMAASGGGLPEEISAVKDVTTMLLNHRVVDVETEAVDNRCILKSLKLDNGAILKLSASGYGAMIYKIVTEERDASASGTDGKPSEPEVGG